MRFYSSHDHKIWQGQGPEPTEPRGNLCERPRHLPLLTYQGVVPPRRRLAQPSRRATDCCLGLQQRSRGATDGARSPCALPAAPRTPPPRALCLRLGRRPQHASLRAPRAPRAPLPIPSARACSPSLLCARTPARLARARAPLVVFPCGACPARPARPSAQAPARPASPGRVAKK